jgi:hypothetical protein
MWVKFQNSSDYVAYMRFCADDILHPHQKTEKDMTDQEKLEYLECIGIDSLLCEWNDGLGTYNTGFEYSWSLIDFPPADWLKEYVTQLEVAKRNAIRDHTRALDDLFQVTRKW